MNELDKHYSDTIRQAVADALAAMDTKDYHITVLRLMHAADTAVSMLSNHQFARGQESVMGMWHPPTPVVVDGAGAKVPA